MSLDNLVGGETVFRRPEALREIRIDLGDIAHSSHGLEPDAAEGTATRQVFGPWDDFFESGTVVDLTPGMFAEEDKHLRDLQWDDRPEPGAAHFGGAVDLTEGMVVRAVAGRARRPDQRIDYSGGRHVMPACNTVLGSDYFDS